MKDIDKLISLIKDIDKALDKYEYGNLTYEEYIEHIQNNLHGNNSIRYKYFNGKHIWADWMQQNIDELKNMTNKLYLVDKNRYILTKDDIDILHRLPQKLNKLIEGFVKNTDGCSLWALQSEEIRDNLYKIINILNKNISILC